MIAGGQTESFPHVSLAGKLNSKNILLNIQILKRKDIGRIQWRFEKSI